jgi:two-component system cell cycle sensor histidine kinase/response regulator CckA
MKALRSDGLWFNDVKAKRKDGTIFWVQVSAAMVFDKEGGPAALTSTSIDITERKRMENFSFSAPFKSCCLI